MRGVIIQYDIASAEFLVSTPIRYPQAYQQMSQAAGDAVQ